MAKRRTMAELRALPDRGIRRVLMFREWKAIEEALNARLAGEIDIAGEPGVPAQEDYESALAKVQERTHGKR